MWIGRVLAWYSLAWAILGWGSIMDLLPLDVSADAASWGVGLVFAFLCLAAIHFLRPKHRHRSAGAETQRLSGGAVTRTMWQEVERGALLVYCVLSLILVLPLCVLLSSIR